MRISFLSKTKSAAIYSVGTMGSILALSIGSTGVSAQEVSSGALEEITVTARKIEESLQETPVSVTAFTGEDLAVRFVTTLDDISRITPNMSFFASAIAGKNSGQAYIRGVGQFDYILSTDPGVGVYVDGVYLARSLGNILDLVDIERVEILRGPQGTLYGKNTVGGAINVITRKPADEVEGMVEARTGSYDRIDVRANSSIPLIKDVLNAKVAFSSRNADGFGSRPLAGERPGDQDSNAIQGVLDWTPVEKLEVLVSMDYSRVREQFSYHHTEEINTAAPLVALHNALLPPYDERYITSDPFTDLSTGKNFNDQEIWGVSGTITWEGGVTVKSITAYRDMDVSFGTDPDGSPEIIIDEEDRNEQNQFSQELQFSDLAFDDRLKWVAGLYYLREDGSATFDLKAHSDLFPALEALPGAFIPLGPVVCPPPPGVPLPCAGGAGNPLNRIFDLDQFNTIDQTTDSYSAYGQGVYDFTDKLSGTYGIRYTDEKKDFVSSSFITRSQFFLLAPTPADDSWTDVSHRFSVDYEWTAELMTYVSAAKGFKSGGFNGRARAVNEVQSYEPEEIWSYEIGFKSEWLDRRLRVNGAGFYNDYTDLQFTLSTVVDGLQSIVVGNAAEAEMLGFELEFQAVPTERLNLTATVGYLDSEYTEVDPGAPITTANKLIGAPKWTAAVGGEYSFPVGDWGDIRLRADYSYRSKVYFDAVNTESTAQDGYGLVNLRAAFESASGRWSIGAGVTNATDKTYKVMGVGVLESLGFSSAIYGRPREWFLEGSYDF